MEIEPKIIKSPPLIPKICKTEYTVSIYAIIIPKIIIIHAASLILGQSKIAKKVAAAPRISWLEINIVCPASMDIVSLKNGKKSSFAYAIIIYIYILEYKRVI